MAAPYSDDLRQKVIAAIDRGERKSHVCRLFKLSRNTLDSWLKLRQQTGSIRANRAYQRGPKPKIADLEAFRPVCPAKRSLNPTSNGGTLASTRQ